MEFSPPVFAAQFGVPFLWLGIVLLMATAATAVGGLLSARALHHWAEKGCLAAGNVLEFVQGDRHPSEEV